jgi:hypothetical protein
MVTAHRLEEKLSSPSAPWYSESTASCAAWVSGKNNVACTARKKTKEKMKIERMALLLKVIGL